MRKAFHPILHPDLALRSRKNRSVNKHPATTLASVHHQHTDRMIFLRHTTALASSSRNGRIPYSWAVTGWGSARRRMGGHNTLVPPKLPGSRDYGVRPLQSLSTLHQLCATTTTTQMQPALQQQQYQSIRNYHTTSKREIVPLILATVVVGGGYYSYRALQRMDTEWEDYQWALQQYERQQLKNTTEESPQQKAVAIDLGTVYTKLATRTATLDKPGVEVAVSREGDRAFFNGIGYDHDNGGGSGDTVVTCRGRSALERFYFSKEQQQHQPPVTLPSFAILLGLKIFSSPHAVPPPRVAPLLL